MKYYLIHNGQEERKNDMLHQCTTYGIPLCDINWIIEPNSIESIPSYITSIARLTRGTFICTYKHYLALEDICKNKYELAVVMEDNIYFDTCVPTQIDHYLSQLPDDWSILFDSDIQGIQYDEGPIVPSTSVYRKNNSGGSFGGSSKGANFYLIKLKTAQLLYENFLPFTREIDWHYNYMFQQLDIHSYWVEPPNVHHTCKKSTSSALYFKRDTTKGRKES
jgi:GR25 family glycosyltransferase involved in LPS biosynthesis